MKIKLKNKIEFDNSSIIETDGTLFVYIHGEYTMKEVFDAFYDQKNTAIIVFDDCMSKKTFKGFIALKAVRQESQDFISVVLKKE